MQLNEKMGKGKTLTDEEKERIAALSLANGSASMIAKSIKRSKNVVLSYLKNPQAYEKKSFGRSKKKTSKEERRKVREASNSTLSFNWLRKTLHLTVFHQQFEKKSIKQGVLSTANCCILHCCQKSN